MKHLIKLFYLTTFIVAFAMLMHAEVPLVDDLGPDTFGKTFVDATKENKPVMVLVHSNTCYSSRIYMRKVVNTPNIQKQLSSGFLCVKADVATREGKQFARRNGVFALPAIFFISSDKSIKYKGKLSLDSNILQNEMKSFTKCVNIKEQIELYKSTNNVSLKQAQIAIANYYSKHDQNKSHSDNPKLEVETYTMGLEWFADFEKAYMQSRAELTKNNKK